MFLGETFGVKQDSLVSGYTKILQDIIKDRRIRWENFTQQSFARFLLAHPKLKKNWNKDETRMMDGNNYDEWDTTLCAKVLLLPHTIWTQYQLPFPFKVTQDEITAIEDLRNLRNNTKHRVSEDDITEREFEKNCRLVSSRLQILGVSTVEISKIIEEAKVLAVVDKNKVTNHINKLKETDWKFKTLKVLGSGSFGIVIHAQDDIDESNSAVKLIPNREHGLKLEENETVIKEAKLWVDLNHDNVVKYKTASFFALWPATLKKILHLDQTSTHLTDFMRACFQRSDETKKIIKGLYIQTELCGSTLRKWLHMSQTNQDYSDLAPEICLGLVSGVNYIHQNRIVHRDLRPENIYFSIGRDFMLPIKIGDFGLSTRLLVEHDASTLSKDVGNPLYRAPEMSESHETKSDKAKYGSAVDVYSVGLIISEIFDPEVSIQATRMKFNKIIYKLDTGRKIKRNFPRLDEIILKFTSEESDERQDRDEYGKTMPMSICMEDFQKSESPRRMQEIPRAATTFATNLHESTRRMESLRFSSSFQDESDDVVSPVQFHSGNVL